MASPSVGAGVTATRSGGGGAITVNLTVATDGATLVVATAHLDTATFVATGVTGVAGVTFSKISEGAVVAENGYPEYKGAPSVWVATNVPHGTYTISVDIAGSADVYGVVTAMELGACAVHSNSTNSGNSTSITTGAVAVPADSVTISCAHISPASNVGFSGPAAGWVRQGVNNDGVNCTGFVCDSNTQTAAGAVTSTWTVTSNSAPWSTATVVLVGTPSAPNNAPTIGGAAMGTRAGGSGGIQATVTVSSAGAGVLVGTVHSDTACFAPTAVTGIAGVSFTKVVEGPVVAASASPSYKGAPTLWLAMGVPVGTYTVTVEFAGSADVYGTAYVQEVGAATVQASGSNTGTSSSPSTGSINAPDSALVVGIVRYPSGQGDAGLTAPPGWSRQGVQQNSSSNTASECDSLRLAAATQITGTWGTSGANSPWSVAYVVLVPDGGLRALIAGGLYWMEMETGDTVDAPGNSDHGAFDGLLFGDPHPQYQTPSEGDARYSGPVHTHTAGALLEGASLTGDIAILQGGVWTYGEEPGVACRLAELGGAQVSSSTSLADVSGLAMNMAANGVYQIECEVTFQSAAATTGLNLGLSTPSGARNMVEIVVPIDSNASATALRTIFPNGATATNAGNVIGTGVTAANTNQTARISGIVRNGATAGPCHIQFASEVAGSAVTIQAGSCFSLLRVA